MLLLDKRHLQRWGVKEYLAPFRFALPNLKGDEFFVMDGGRPVWCYPDAPIFKKMAEDFPETGAAARRLPLPDAEAVRAWLEANAPNRRKIKFDLL